jgi:hypothetical protein
MRRFPTLASVDGLSAHLNVVVSRTSSLSSSSFRRRVCLPLSIVFPFPTHRPIQKFRFSHNRNFLQFWTPLSISFPVKTKRRKVHHRILLLFDFAADDDDDDDDDDMVRLTTELVAKAPSYINPVKDRELDLRGNRIPQIENLAVSKVSLSLGYALLSDCLRCRIRMML